MYVELMGYFPQRWFFNAPLSVVIPLFAHTLLPRMSHLPQILGKVKLLEGLLNITRNHYTMVCGIGSVLDCCGLEPSFFR